MSNQQNNKMDEKAPEVLEAVESTLSKTELYVEENKKSIFTIAIIIVLIVGGFMAYKHLYVATLEKEAQETIFQAQNYFEKDSFNLALYGDGNYMGFEYVAEKYSRTECGNLANYYAGVSAMHLGKYEDAINFLKKFDSDDAFVGALAIGAIGDAQLQLGDKNAALASYKKAANKNANELTAPVFLMKAAQLMEDLGQNKDAVAAYKKIQKEYPTCQQARDIEKYITRAENN